MSQPSSPTAPHVVVAGGGIAGLEALIALRTLAGDRLRLTLLAPEPDFVYRPLSLAEPFGLSRATRHPLSEIARDFDAELVPSALRAVHPLGHRLATTAGEELSYASLVVAVGARDEPVFDHALTIRSDRAHEALEALLLDLELGDARAIAFVVPRRRMWALPLYELALVLARTARNGDMPQPDLRLVTPERSPLEVFGDDASTMVAEALADAGVAFLGSTVPQVEPGAIRFADRRLRVDRTVSLPVPVGPSLPGLPEDSGGFVPVDAHCRVQGTPDVFAAGDVTDQPIKQGGLGAQQAVAAAQAVAASHGLPVDARPFRPILRGLLLTGGDGLWMRAADRRVVMTGRASSRAMWWPPTKVVSSYLDPYLLAKDRPPLASPAEAPR